MKNLRSVISILAFFTVIWKCSGNVMKDYIADFKYCIATHFGKEAVTED